MKAFNKKKKKYIGSKYRVYIFEDNEKYISFRQGLRVSRDSFKFGKCVFTGEDLWISERYRKIKGKLYL